MHHAGFFRAPPVVTAIAMCLTLVCLPQASALAQRVRAPTDSLVRAARGLAENGDTSTALQVLERATDQSPRDVDALYWRGLMISRSINLAMLDWPRAFLAGRLLERANSIDPRNPRYLIELGRIRLKTPMRRIEAERLFRKALSVAEASGDPAQLADVCWELGQIKERRYSTAKDRYMITSPGMMYDPAQAIQQLHYTREFLAQHAAPIENVGAVDRSEAEEYYRRALRANPLHENSAVGLLGLLYDQRRFQEMREVARPFLVANAGDARIRLAAGLAAYRSGKLADAAVQFDSALAKLTSSDRDDFLSIDRIIRRTDAVSYNSLSKEDRLHTDSAYWESADPLLATPENEARLEFLARLAAADLRFTSTDTRQIGWRTDRGLILARYGEPPVVATFAPSSEPDAADATGRVITVWYYPRKERQFVFMGPPAMNYATFAGDMRGIAEEMREDAPFLLDNVGFAADIDSIPIQLVRLRSPSADQSQLVIAASVDTKQLYRAAELDRGALALSVRLGLPSRMRLSYADTVPVTLPATARTDRTWVQTLPAGHYRVRIEAQDVAVLGAAGRAQAEISVMPPATGVFDVSDLMIAERMSTPAASMVGWRESGIVPKGSLTLRQREVFSVYWENYGLRPDSAGRVRVDVRLRVTLLEIDRSGKQGLVALLGEVADAVGLTREREQTLGIQFQREEPASSRVPMATTIGFGSAPPGTYRLELIITDRVSGSVARAERTLQLGRQ